MDDRLSQVHFQNGIELYWYQEESVLQLLEYERVGTCGNRPTCAVLTEPIGCGKTIELLAFIMASPIPKYSRPVPVEKSNGTYTMRPTEMNQILRPTAIVVSRSVLGQWLDHILRYTTLNVFVVRDVACVRTLCELIRSGDINDFDIVLVKYGQTRTTHKTRDLKDIINRAISPMFWSRVIYDDIDLMTTSCCMRALSSVFVTGATAIRESRESLRLLKCISLDIMGLLNDLPLVGSAFEGCPPRIWALNGHDEGVLANFLRMYTIICRNVTISAPDRAKVARMLTDISSVNCEELISMVLGDAMSSASQFANTTVATPYALFAGVLGSQRQSYEVARARRSLLREFCDSDRDLSNDDTPIAQLAAHPVGKLADWESCYKSKDCAKQALQEIVAYLTLLDRSFERIRENFARQECSVCYANLDEGKIVIMRCCGFIVCDSCAMRASQLHAVNKNVVGVCVQCRRPINIANGDFILVDQNVNVAELVERVVSGPTPVAPVAPVAQVAQSHPSSTKTDYVINLLRNAPIAPDIRVSESTWKPIPGVMNGDRVLMPTGARKFLICSLYDEVTMRISDELSRIGVAHQKLVGSSYELYHKAREFARGENNVLIINVRSIFAGIDLSSTTDIVLCDSLSVASCGQIIGRAQRIGRSCSLTVHNLMYVH